jgi:hypothetical protein
MSKKKPEKLNNCRYVAEWILAAWVLLVTISFFIQFHSAVPWVLARVGLR